MNGRRWSWAAVAALSAVACGGQAELQEQDADAGTPPSGFYSVSWQTVSDSCDPLRPQGATEELVGATSSMVTLTPFATGHAHQEIHWDEPFFFTANGCELALALDVTSKSSHSFVVDSQVDWGDPAPGCQRWTLWGVPNAACSVHQIASYELLQACPTTRNNVSCTN